MRLRLKGKFREGLSVGLDFMRMLSTVDPEADGMKVLGKPKFLGGPATKLSQIEPLLVAADAPYSSVFCFSSVYAPLFMLRALKRKGAKILVNQNGVYYPSWFPTGWRKKNRYLKRLNDLADHSFFQSEFALETYRKWVGEPPASYSILRNAVDLSRFTPAVAPSSAGLLRVLIFTDVSGFTRPIWEKVFELIDSHKQSPLFISTKVEWVALGRVHDRDVFRELKFEDRIRRGDLENHFGAGNLVSVIQTCELGLHLVHNDVCPNKVLEAMACGVWVIGLSAGGTKELIGTAGTVIPVEGGYAGPRLPTVTQLRSAISDFVSTHRGSRNRVCENARRFDLKGWREEVHRRGAEK